MSTTTTAQTIGPVERLGVRRLLGWAAVRVRENPALVGLFLLAGLAGYVPFVGGLLGFLATTFALGMAYVVVADGIGRRDRGLGTVAGDVRERYVTLLLVSLAYVAAVLVGLLLLVIPGLYVAVRLSPAVAVATLSDRGVADSLREGWAVGRGSVLRLGAVFLAVLLAQAVAAGVLAAVSTDLASWGLSAVLLNAVSGPVLAAAVAHVYFESRDTVEEESDVEATVDAAV